MCLHHGGVAELLSELLHEIVPVWVTILGYFGVVRVAGPQVLSSVGPPVFGRVCEEGGGEYDHEGRDPLELMSEHFETSVTVP